MEEMTDVMTIKRHLLVTIKLKEKISSLVQFLNKHCTCSMEVLMSPVVLIQVNTVFSNLFARHGKCMKNECLKKLGFFQAVSNP